MAKKESSRQRKMHEVMSEYKMGTLHSGSKKGPVVKNRKQAIAIGLKKSGQSRKSGRRKKKK